MKKLPLNQTKNIIQLQAVMNFWFACHNVDKFNLIRNAFKGLSLDQIHGMEKRFEKIDYDVFELIKGFREPERAKLILYIVNEYNGVSVDSIKKHYMGLC